MKKNKKYMLIRNIKLPSNSLINISQYWTKDILLYTILVIYLETNLSKKFNWNLRNILIEVLDPNNQINALYKVFFTKLIDIL